MITKQDIIDLEPCEDAVEWLKDYDNIEVAWNECERGDWLLWLVFRVTNNNRKLTLAKARCAKLVRHLMTDERSRKAVEIAEKYGLGEVDIEELKTARTAADAAWSARSTWSAWSAWSAVDADTAAAYAAAAAADATHAIHAADAAAVHAADAADTAADAAEQKVLADCANIVRSIYNFSELGR